MPTVPSNFVPSVETSSSGGVVPFQATPGQPMQNLAGAQAAEYGQALTAAGSTGKRMIDAVKSDQAEAQARANAIAKRLAEKVEDDLNDADASDGEISFQRLMQDTLYGKNGALIVPQTEESVRTANERMSVGLNDIGGKRRGPIAKQIFEARASRSFVNAQGQILQSFSKDTALKNIVNAEARIEPYIIEHVGDYKNFNIPGSISQTSSDAVVRLTMDAARLRGVADGSPQMEQVVRDTMTRMTLEVAKRQAGDGNYNDAIDLIQKRMDAKAINLEAGNQMILSLQGAQKLKSVPELVGSIVNGRGLNTPSGTDNIQAPVMNASRKVVNDDNSQVFTIPSNASIAAPANGQVTKVFDDPNSGRTMIIRTRDGTELRFSNVDPTMNEGDWVHQGQLVALPNAKPMKEDDYVQRSGESSFTFTITRDGKRVDPRLANALKQDYDPTTAKPPLTRAESLKFARQIEDPETRRMVASGVDKVWDAIDADKADRYTASKNMVADAMAAGQPIPTGPFNDLTPSDQKHFMDKQLEESSLDVMTEIAIAGGATPEYLERNWRRMTQADYKSQVEKTNSVNAAQAKLDADQFNMFLLKNGMGTAVLPEGDENKKHALKIRQSVESLLRAEQKRLGKMALTPEETERVFAQVIKDTVLISDWGYDTVMPLRFVKDSDYNSAYVTVKSLGSNVAEIVYLSVVPPSYREGVIEFLTKRHGREPTEQEIVQEWVNSDKPIGWRVPRK